MVVGFTTTHAISDNHHLSLNPAHGEMYSIQHYVIKFVSDLCGRWFLRFPPPIKLIATILLKLKAALNTIILTPKALQ